MNDDDGLISQKADIAGRQFAVTADTRATRGAIHSLVVWLTLLAVVFLTEYSVMLILFRLFPARSSPMLLSAVDAIILTLILAPVLWWTLVRPIAETNRLRSQFLADLFAQIEMDRRQTAYELHDGVGQSLTLLISGLRSATSCRAVEECAGRVNQFQRLAENALVDVRRLALGLRPNLLDDLGIAAALEHLVEDMRTHSSVEISLDVSGVIGLQFSEQVATAVFRIIQEALANVVKHSQAKHAVVTVRTANA
jgi:signal transduction histidine kinase